QASDTLVEVVPVTCRPAGVGGGVGLPVGVVTVTFEECADSPAALVAVTLNVYWVPVVRPGTVSVVPGTDGALVEPRWALEPVAPAEAFHDRETLVVVVPVTASPVGAGGGVGVPPCPVSVTSSAK